MHSGDQGNTEVDAVSGVKNHTKVPYQIIWLLFQLVKHFAERAVSILLDNKCHKSGNQIPLESVEIARMGQQPKVPEVFGLNIFHRTIGTF